MDALIQLALNQPSPIAFLSLMIPLICFIYVLFGSRRRLPYPPGPKGLPIIGNMSMMDQLTHHGLAKLAKQYGGILRLRMGFLNMVAISTAEAAREVLQVQDSIFSNRPATITISYLTYDRADLVFAHYGPFWRKMRKLCVMKLFSRKRTESWEAVRDEVDAMVRAVGAHTGTKVNIGELVFTLMKNIIYRAAFGTSSNSNEGQQDEFIAIIQEFSKLFVAFNVADFIPGLGWLDPQGLNKKLAKARESLDKFIDTIIDDHLEKKKMMKKMGISDDGGNDMVDDLLAFYSEEPKVNEVKENLQNAIKLTKDNIKAIVMDVMFGSMETVASSIEWAMSELMKSPDELKRVQQELEDTIGLDRRIEEADFEKLTYLKCILKEALRLHPPVPLLLHESSEDAEIGGYRIPKRSHVTINVWAIGRDENSWEDAECFKPSRFLKEGAPDFRGGNFEFIPFGSGRRSCPGMQLGVYALESAVAHLLHCFNWELPDGMSPSELDMNDAFGLTVPKATRLVAVPTKRVVFPL